MLENNHGVGKCVLMAAGVGLSFVLLLRLAINDLSKWNIFNCYTTNATHTASILPVFTQLWNSMTVSVC